MNNWRFIIEPIQKPDYFWFIFSFVVLAIVFSFILQYLQEKKVMPKFQRNFLIKISNWLLYIPTISLMFLLALYFDIPALSIYLYFVILGFIWLIWFLFLLYYRLVTISFLSKKYKEKKQTEKYK